MSALPGGTVRLAADLTLTRVGYGAMQLAEEWADHTAPAIDRWDSH